MIRAVFLALVLLLPAVAVAQETSLVFDTRRGAGSSQEALFDAAARADVVFVGELHDDKAAHRLELDLLRALADQGRPVVLVMEMFERDVQPALDAYLTGGIDEARMLARTRPWSNYKQDYRPLLEFARARHWPVVAGNIPRPLASKIAKQGLATLTALPAAERAQAAADLQCPQGPYRDKFIAEMSEMAGHGGKGGKPDLGRMFEAQCAKDETMAQSVAARLIPRTTVVHLNGVFHSDEGLGVVEGLKRRRPNANTLVISITKGAAPQSAKRALGDFVIWTP